MLKIDNRGFTLVELLAVLVILITIMSVAVPTISSSLDKSKEKQEIERKDYLKKAAELYVADNKNKLVDSDNLCIKLDDLRDNEYITSDNLIDINGNRIDGYIKYNRLENTYEYDDGSFCKGKNTTIIEDDEEEKEENNNNNDNDTINNVKELEIGDYVNYESSNASFKISGDWTGYSDQTLKPNELKLWRVISKKNTGVEIISVYVSSNDVVFRGNVGYKNFVYSLDKIAQAYINENYSTSARYFGYNGQTKRIDNFKFKEVIWRCSTGEGCNPTENLGGGDVLYRDDYSLIRDIFDTRIAKRVGTNIDTAYWISSRHYQYLSSNKYGFYGRYVTALGGKIEYDTINSLRSLSLISMIYDEKNNNSIGKAIRPIVTLKSSLKCKGEGTLESPCDLVAS